MIEMLRDLFSVGLMFLMANTMPLQRANSWKFWTVSALTAFWIIYVVSAEVRDRRREKRCPLQPN